VTVVVLDREILLNLACHVAAEVHLAQITATSRQRQDHGRCELVVSASSSLDSFENMNGVPYTLGIATLGRSCN
jgi:hypothetical protein